MTTKHICIRHRGMVTIVPDVLRLLCEEGGCIVYREGQVVDRFYSVTEISCLYTKELE